jgi:hypothetical protein
MVKLLGPLHSMLASGQLQTGLQLVNAQKSCHLVQPHIPRTTFTRAQLGIRSFVMSLARAWSSWAPAVGATWLTHPRAQVTSPYHAYLWENHQRRKKDQWPIIVWDVPPSGAPPGYAARVSFGGARCFTLHTTYYVGNKTCFAVISIAPHKPTVPMNIRDWSWNAYSGLNYHLASHLEAGTYACNMFLIDGFGQISVPLGFTGIVVSA